MASKRGRPISGESDSVVVNQQRQQARDRMRRIRRERRVQTATPAPPTSEQLQQGEHIINLSSVEEETTPQTLAQVGLRVQNITLARDASNTELQHKAEAVDEHDILYETDTTHNINHSHMPYSSTSGFFRRFAAPASHNAAAKNGSRHERQPGLPQYFRSLPPSNPFATRIATSPAREQEDNFMIAANDSLVLSSIEDDVRSNGGVTSNSTNQDVPGTESSMIRGSEDQLAESSSEDEGSATRNDDENGESFHDFVSEHSVHSNDGDEQDETSAQDYMVQKLYDQLAVVFHGCSEEQHAEKLRKHMETAGDNHHGLSEIFNDSDFPSVLGLSEMITPERLARQESLSSSQWSSMFCGVSRRRPTPMNVCIHKEQTQAVVSDVAYDIDSLIVFATSLAISKKGLWVQPVPQMRQNMTTDVHIETQVFHTGDDPEQRVRSSATMLRDVPHFLLGRVVGAHDITIHVLFPHMTVANEKFVSLTKEQMTRWLDDIFLPALHMYYDPHYTQHLPASLRHAFANSKAHQVEGRLVETASYQAQQSIGYHLQPEYLDAMWSTMLETIANIPGLADFREPQLVLSAKGTKLQFKTTPSESRKKLLNAINHFKSFLEDIFDLAFA